MREMVVIPVRVSENGARRQMGLLTVASPTLLSAEIGAYGQSGRSKTLSSTSTEL